MGNAGEISGEAVKQQVDDLVLGYPMVGSSFLASSAVIYFPVPEHELL